jgi:hypothetical protein
MKWTSRVEVIAPEASIYEAAEKMSHLDIGPLPVCDGERLVQPGEKKNPFCVRPSWHIMTPYAQTTLPEE